MSLSAPSLNLAYSGASAPVAASGAMTGYAYALQPGNGNALQIRHLNSSFALTTSPGALRFVELTLTLSPPGVQATTARTVVALRND